MLSELLAAAIRLSRPLVQVQVHTADDMTVQG